MDAFNIINNNIFFGKFLSLRVSDRFGVAP